MEKTIVLFLLITNTSFAQVGIGTTSPQGALDVFSSNLSLVIPRVTSIEAVTDGNGGVALDATIVYDISRSKTCFKIAGKWICLGEDVSGNPILTDETPPVPLTIPVKQKLDEVDSRKPPAKTVGKEINSHK